jgi:thiosulfate/3-mercaptopyruvate sulfurtransferase
MLDVDMLVETAWLAGRLADPAVVVVDMRWREDGSAPDLYVAGHIQGATFLDWTTDLVDRDHPVAFMLAPPEAFAAAMERAGIGDDTHVVAYADQHGSGPSRLWWASRRYGHRNVSVLDGGLDKWVAEARTLSNADAPLRPNVRWTPRPVDGMVASAKDVLAAPERGVSVLDSRPPEQFRGRAVWFEAGAVPAGADGIARTPRGDLRAGRVPWASNVPAAQLYRNDFTMKDPGELRSMLLGVGVEPGSPAITYCGVGISASALFFALRRAGVEDVALYDGSWEEWGRDPRLPLARDAD